MTVEITVEDWEFPIEALCIDVQRILAADVDITKATVEHFFGLAERSTHGDYPRYVWVPTRTRERKQTPVRQVDEHRALFAMREHFEVDCWGASFKQAWALRHNLLVAIHKSTFADLRFENGEWVEPAAGLTQHGELYRVELSLGVPVPDAYVNVPDLKFEGPAMFTPTAYTADVHVSPEVDADRGFITVTTADPTP